MDAITIVRKWYTERDPTVWSDRAVWELPNGFPHGGIYRGKDAVFGQFYPRLKADWSEWKADCRELFNSDEFVVGEGLYTAVCKATGKRLASPFVHLFSVVDDKIAYHRSFVDVAAFQAAQEA